MTDLKKLCLECGDIEIEGCGSISLTLKARAHRFNKIGRVERYDLQLSVGRYVIQRLARQIATMHERDRARLAREMQRIEAEVAAITQPNTPKEI
jgi:hypothetical protein